MPYEISDIPDAVKKLSLHAQEIWISAFNAALKEYGDEDTAYAIAWAAAKRKTKGKKKVTNMGDGNFQEDKAAKDAQKSRRQKYGISVRDDGHVTKPSEWSDVPDSKWLDPVNYAYPCPDADQTRAAAAYWGKAKNKAKYSSGDQAIMTSRLDKFKEKFGISSDHEEGWVSVFSTGVHTDSSGNTEDWTAGQLDDIVAKYDPTNHEAPIVIGHPKSNDPAYGWVEALKHEGGVLFAKFKQVVPEFKDMLINGLFKKRSISLYPDKSLRHIGYLGAVPPAVKGLPGPAFANDVAYITIETPEEGLTMHKFFEKLKRLFQEVGVNLADVAEYETYEEVAEKNRKLHEDAIAMVVAKKKQELEASFVEREAEVARREQETARKEQESARKVVAAEVAAFCESLAKEGKVTPALMKEGLAEFLISIAGRDFDFGENDGKVSSYEFAKKLVGELPVVVAFKKVADKDKLPGSFEERVEELVKKGKKKGDALREIILNNPDLHTEYLDSIQ